MERQGGASCCHRITKKRDCLLTTISMKRIHASVRSLLKAFRKRPDILSGKSEAKAKLNFCFST